MVPASPTDVPPNFITITSPIMQGRASGEKAAPASSQSPTAGVISSP